MKKFKVFTLIGSGALGILQWHKGKGYLSYLPSVRDNKIELDECKTLVKQARFFCESNNLILWKY